MYHVLVPDKSLRKIEKRDVVRSVRKGAACLECKRRKVACSRDRPCKSCVRFKCEERCIDEDTKQKLPPQKRLSAVVTSLNNCLAILQKLIPNVSPELLVQLSKEQLRELIEKGDGEVKWSSSSVILPGLENANTVSSISSHMENLLHVSDGSDAGGMANSIRLTADPDGNDEGDDSDDPDSAEDWARVYGWEEDVDEAHNVADDVNSLNLGSTTSQTSYLGPCSVSAVLKLILRLGSDYFEPEGHAEQKKISQIATEAAGRLESKDDGIPVFSFRQGLKLIDAYFEFVHTTTPMIHEATFRATYASRQKKRPSWLALLFIVLACGSIATTDVDSTEDIKYYRASRSYLRNLGGGNLEYLQAMILMSGHYMHYRNLPNTASVYSGAAFKLATGLGLHRELPIPKLDNGSSSVSTASFIHRETLRRTWWTLYKTEISGLFTLGRPSIFGGIAATVEMPQNIDDRTLLPSVGQVTPVSALILEVQLCRILEQIEAIYVRTSSPTFEEVSHFDNELLTWFENCPPYMKDIELVPDSSKDAMLCIKWEYFSARVMLFRTFLLRAALSRKRVDQLPMNPRFATENCRAVARDAINTICDDWRPYKISCWSAVWYLFQVTLVPLVTLFSEDRHNPTILRECRSLVEKSILHFERMRQWGHTAEQSGRVMRYLYDTSRKLPEEVAIAPSPVDLWEELFWRHQSEEGFLLQNDVMEFTWDNSTQGIYEDT